MARDDVEEKLRKLASVDPDEARRAWLLYLAGEGEERREAEELMDAALFNRVRKSYPKDIFLEPAPKGLCAGEYNVGTILYPPGHPYGPFGLREEEWIRHVLITGMTGTGKTNLMFHLLRQFKSRGKPFIVFDWKRNYRDLRQLPEFSDLEVYTVGRDVRPLRFNPLLPPPGTGAGEWLMKLVDVIKHAYFVGEGVEYLLRDALEAVYEHTGYLDGSEVETPTFETVKARVGAKHLQGRMSLWKASAIRVLESLCFRHGLGPVLNTDERWDHEAALNGSVVLELDALADADKVFLIEALILWIYELRKNEGKRERFKHALVIEEGHHVLSRHKENVEGNETIMETSLRQIREFGEAVVVLDQEPTKLSNSIKANTYCKLTFNLGNGKDVLEMANCMGLNLEERDCIALLEVGHAIVSLQGRVFQAMQVRIPMVGIRKQ